MPDSFIPPVVANFIANYSDAVAGSEAVATSMESIGPAAAAASAEAQGALDRLAVSVDALDGQMSLFGDRFASEDGQFALFGAAAEDMATKVDTSATSVSASLDRMSITMAGDRAKWVADCAEMEAAMDTMVANMNARASEAAAANDAIATSSTKTATVAQEGMLATGKQFMGLGAGMTVGAGAIIGVLTDIAGNFDQKMELIRTNDHDTTDSIQQMEQAVLQMAPAVGQMPNALADGLYHIVSTGQRGAAALDILRASAQDATTGIADLDSVTYAMSGVMSIAMPDIKSASDGVALLNDIVGQGDMRMNDLASAIGTGVLPVFKSAGLGAVDFGAAIATITDNSTPAEVSANHLKTTIQMMQNQSGPAAAALEQLGIRSGELASDISKPGGLLVAVEDVRSHLDHYTATGKTAQMTTAQIDSAVAQMGRTLTSQNVPVTEQTDLLAAYRSSLEHMGSAGIQAAADLSKAFGGARSAMTMETLVGEVDKLRSKYDQMGTAASRQAQQQRDWNDTQAQFKVKLADAKAGLDALAISIGQYLIPFVDKILGMFSTFSHYLSEHAGLAKALAIVLGGVLVTGVAMLTAGFVMLAIAIQGTPIGWIFDIGLAITGIVAAIVSNWSSVAGFFSDVWKSITGFFTDAYNDIAGVIGNIISFFEQLPGNIMHGIEALPGLLGRAASAAGSALLNGLKTAGTAVLNFIKNLPYDIGFAIGALAGILARAAVNAGEALYHGIITAGTDVVQFFTVTLPTVIPQALNAAGTWLLKAGQDIIMGLLNGIIAAGTAVVQFFTVTLPRNVVGFFQTAPGWLIHAGQDLIHGLVNGIITAGTDIVRFFTITLPNSIQGFFRDVGSWLINAGEALIHGLLTGIEKAASWLWDQLKNFAQGVVNGFLSFFGIHSPATTMEPVGKGLVDGITHYLGVHGPNAVAAAKSLASQVTGAMTGLTGSASISVAGGPSLGAFNGSTGSVSGSGGQGIYAPTIIAQGSILTTQDLRDLMLEQFQQRGFRNGSSSTFPNFRLGS